MNWISRSYAFVKSLNYNMNNKFNIINTIFNYLLVRGGIVSPDGYSPRSTYIFCNCMGTLMVPLQLQNLYINYSIHVMHYNEVWQSVRFISHDGFL